MARALPNRVHPLTHFPLLRVSVQDLKRPLPSSMGFPSFPSLTHTGSPATSTGLSVGLATERSWDRSPDQACLEAGGGSRASRASFLGKSPN